ncbi:type VII secretion integral membrane protein EccD [Aeromicrobium sp. CF4.19]|uniref:type VII secretion integral membrane protein EccD n=1 Tax=Aeromicrobium sp. CF4.19 TaxID=3373082 RepID=UPI003EE59961
MLTTAEDIRKVGCTTALATRGSDTQGDTEGVHVLTAYSRVTVVTAQRTIDLALPSGLPLADVMPQIMRYAAPERGEQVPTSWTLGRLGGPTLPLVQTLEDAGVLDGDVLELRSQQDDVSPALVEDVRDAVEDSVDVAGGVWTTRTTGSFAVLASVALLGAWALAALVAGVVGTASLADLAEPVAAATAVIGLLGATWWAGANVRPVDAQVAAGVAMLWGVLLGRSVGERLELEPVLVLACAALAMALVAGLARLVTATATAHAAFGVVVLLAAATQAVVGVADVSSMQSVRVLPVLGLLVVGILPRVSLSVGGLASADYRVRHVGTLDLAALRFRYRSSNAILVGALVGISAVVVAAGAWLDVSGEPWDRTLALALAAAAVMRSRLFSRTQHVVPLRVAGVAVAALAAVRLVAQDTQWVPYLIPVTVVAAAVAYGLAALSISEITRARVKRTLNIVEFLAIVTLLVLLAGAVGIYDQLGGLI